MDIGVLGPLELEVAGQPVAVVGTQRRALVSVLLARRGRVVTTDTLVEALWGDDPPRTAVHTLHTHVSRLRRTHELPVRAVDGGYVLDVAPERVDATRFDRLVARATDAPPDDAARLLREALALWRGPAFGRAAELPAVRGEALRLDEARCSAREQLAAALLAVGRTDEAIAELEGLVGDEPYRETAWTALVRALTAVGRPADAVAAVARATVLLDELGLRPSADLRAAQQEALADAQGATPGPRASPDRSPGTPPLPDVASSFVGREADLAVVEDLLAAGGLTTLLGPGGVGKTRLALEVARRHRDGRAGGVRLVELTALTDGAAVAGATVAALGLAGATGTPGEMLRRAGGLDLLVVLDNCEHVLDAVAEVVSELLAAGGPLRVLATTRERFGLPAERVHVVAPLAQEGPDAAGRRLFVDRARAAGAFAGTPGPDPADVARVVRALDGLPLAIEMAAARAATVGLRDLADSLEHDPGDLAHPGRGTPDRHRTLAAVIAWSRALLEPADGDVFADWAVFSGPVRPADAAAVLGAAPDVPERLVRRSLLALDVRDGRTRYRMLHTVRAAVLDGGDVRPGLRASHAAWFERVAREADAALRTSAEPEACRLLTVQVADLRAAHAWARREDPALASRLSGALHVHAIGTMSDEILGWGARLGPAIADDDPAGAAAQVAVAARLVLGGELAAARARAQRALDVTTDDGVRATALEMLADVALYDGLLDACAELGTRLAELGADRGDPHYHLTGLTYPILRAAYSGAQDEARALVAAARATAGRYADLSPSDRGFLEYTAGEVELDAGGPVDSEGASVMSQSEQVPRQPVLQAKNLVKTFGRVVALDGVDLELYPGEVLGIIGDNGAGKSSLVKCLSGAYTPDAGELLLDGRPVRFHGAQEARAAGIETVYQTLAISPALDIASNLYLGREERKPGILGSVFRMLDTKGMRQRSEMQVKRLGISTLQDTTQAVETLSGGQRQAVAVARAAAFGSKVIILDEPTAALGVREGNQVLQMIRELRDRGLPVILISHNMQHVFEVADRVHIQRLGRRAAVVTPQTHSAQDAVAIMTGATQAA